MPQFRSKPDTVEAVQFFQTPSDTYPDWVGEALRADIIAVDETHEWIVKDIHDPDSFVGLDAGDWLIKGSEGAITVLTDDVFSNAYEAVA